MWISTEDVIVICSSWSLSSHLQTLRNLIVWLSDPEDWRSLDQALLGPHHCHNEVEIRNQEGFSLGNFWTGRNMGTRDSFPSLPLFLTLARMSYLDAVSQGSRKEQQVEEG